MQPLLVFFEVKNAWRFVVDFQQQIEMHFCSNNDIQAVVPNSVNEMIYDELTAGFFKWR